MPASRGPLSSSPSPARAGRWLGSGQAVHCHYQAAYPAAWPTAMRKTRPSELWKTRLGSSDLFIPNGPGARPPARFEPGRAGGSLVHAGGPAGLDVAEPPVGEGGGPDRDEQGDDAEPGGVDVEVGHRGPEGAVQVQFGGQHAEDLDGADDERRADGQPGDDQVVVDLADRPG